MNTPCCEWKGTKNYKGYGVIALRGKQYKVHRLAILLSGRKIPKGMVTDHLCRNRACINPEHLEVVTNGENVMRGESFAPKNKLKTHCPKGHQFHDKVRIYKGAVWRYCKICKLASNRESKKRIKYEKRTL